jgi:MFS family permease
MSIRESEEATLRRSWHDWLGLNASTFALLGAILLVTASTELWAPLVPQYLKGPSRAEQFAMTASVILLVGLYGFYRDLLEAINYFVGGALGGWLNTRRALLLFNVLPLVGFAILFFWTARPEVAVFVAIPFIFVWDSIAGPATITVVGEALPSDRRTMAFSLQSIFRRVSRFAAYGISALLIWTFGSVEKGFRADLAVSSGLVLIAAAIQLRYMRTVSRDAGVMIHRPIELLRRFDPDLKRLLAADIFARWAEGLAGPFIILYCVPLLSDSVARGAAIYQSGLLTIQAATNILLYILVGPLASRAGLAKKPFIGLTFLFFALFPISLAVLGPTLGVWGLGIAFVVGGFREIGEPARKAMISDLVPKDTRTQAVGLYWSARSVAVMLASPFGALAWIMGDAMRPGLGPLVTFWLAGLVGLVGAFAFFKRFGSPSSTSSSGDRRE